MGALDFLLEQVKNAITGHTAQQNQNPTQAYDESGLLDTIGNIFGQHQDQGNAGYDNVLPASQDPYGDPADQGGGFGNVLPASADPYGDPADQGGGDAANVLPASQDPYGDPADQR